MPNIEIYLCEKKYFSEKFKNKLVLDIHFFEPAPKNSKIRVSNLFAEKMIRRTIKIFPTWLIFPFYISYLNSFFDQKHIVKNLSSNKDPLGLLDKYESHFNFTEDEIKKGKKILRKFGVDESDKFICLNVRDASYLSRNFPENNFSYHNYRDVDIEIFSEAIEELLYKGFTIFRVGKTSSKSLDIKNHKYIDLTNSDYDDFLDLYLGANCYFCITTSSGFDATPYVFRKKILYIQVPISHFFSSSRRHFISTRYHRDNKNNRILTLKEIFEYDIHNADSSHKFNEKNIELISPSKSEVKNIILEALEYFSNESEIEISFNQRKFWKIYESCVLKDKNLKNFHSVYKAYFSEIQINKLI